MKQHHRNGNTNGAGAVARMILLDLRTAGDETIAGTVGVTLLPLAFAALGLFMTPVAALAFCWVLTVGYWSLSVGALFITTNHPVSGRLGVLLPISRGHQVVGRYLSIGLFAAICLVETAIQYGLMRLIEVFGVTMPWMQHRGATGLPPLLPVLGVTAIVVVIAGCAQAPFFYRMEYAKAANAFWTMVFVLVALGTLIGVLAPDVWLERIATAALGMPGWGWTLAGLAVCVAVVAVSYAVSRRIWLRKEL